MNRMILEIACRVNNSNCLFGTAVATAKSGSRAFLCKSES